VRNQLNGEFEITGRHVLYAMLAFFGVIVAVQAAFIAISISTHTGVVSKQPYRKGLGYSDRIAAQKKQDKLGWNETLVFDQEADQLSLAVVDKDGLPVRGLRVSAVVGRPSTMRYNQAVTFEAADQVGLYQAQFPHAMNGAYIVDLEVAEASNPGKIVWRMRKRLWRQP
jgi:nitrogen fixation protein FixH